MAGCKSLYKLLIFSVLSSILTFNSASAQNHSNDSAKGVEKNSLDSGKITAHNQNHHGVDADHEEKFDMKKTILEHVKDEHGWHQWGHFSLPLPVILKTDKGIEIFSSKHLVDEHHKPAPYKGKYYTYLRDEHEGKIKIVDENGKVDEAANAKLFDFSITKVAATLIIAALLTILLMTWVARKYKKQGVETAPKGFQNFLEMLVCFVRDDIAKPNIGKDYEKFMPFLLTVFFFIWILNLLGLVPFFPGGANASGNISITFVLSLIVFIITIAVSTKDYWKHIFWMPGVPWPMKLFLAPIEFIGVFTKPISLMIRLFANITAGHILVLSLICLTFVFRSYLVGGISTLFASAISLIELLVAFLQAFIFTMLSAMYIGMAKEEHHHDDAHAHNAAHDSEQKLVTAH